MRVLYVAYHFPPTGGAGVQRTLKFVRYLPDFGIEPVVLTTPAASSGRWTPADETLLAQVPDDVEIVRVRGPERSGAAGWRAPAARWLRFPSPWTVWWRREVVQAGRGTSDVDAILCSMSPFESAAAAARVSADLHVPWIADLRDPWALDEMMTWTTGLHRRLELRAMRRVLGTAAAVVMNTQTAAAMLCERFPEFRRKRVVAIPNGFDREDFQGPEPPREDDVFRIVHTGYLHTALGLEQRARSGLRRTLGGAVPGVDFLTRSHVVLLEALDRLAAEQPALAARTELWLAGVLSDADRQVIGDRTNVRSLGYLSHEESIALMRSADLLFLPMHDLPPGRRASIVPGKTYEYLASGRPVLAAVPDGDARDLLERVAGTEVCRPGDAAGMAAAIGRVASRGRAETVERPELRRYERRELTRELADVVRAVCGAENATPASVHAIP
jgi:glycosyltransferase involved in cell wall biosynthesis